MGRAWIVGGLSGAGTSLANISDMPWIAFILAALFALACIVSGWSLLRRAKARASWERAQVPAQVLDDPISMTWGPPRRFEGRARASLNRAVRMATLPQFSGSVALALAPVPTPPPAPAVVRQGGGQRRPRVYFRAS